MKLITYVAIPVIIGLSLVYFPQFWVNTMMLVDFFTGLDLYSSSMYNSYHKFLLSMREERPELPIPEINFEDATRENIIKMTNGFTWPLVIRGLLGNTTGVKNMGDPEWWLSKYPDDEVLCSMKGKILAEQVPNCTIKMFFDQLKTDNKYYITGATSIFHDHPELHDYVNSDMIDQIEPGKRISTQMFMGLPGMGTDIHCAAGVNIFRQVTGSKKWWFIPPREAPYLKPRLNHNGFSAMTHTLVGKEGKPTSPWMTKVERYTAIVNPGDVLINPPFFWHGILNLGDANSEDIVIGSPSRYSRGALFTAAMKSNFLFFTVAVGSMVNKYGLGVLSTGFNLNLQKQIAENRALNDVAAKNINFKGEHPFALEASEAG